MYALVDCNNFYCSCERVFQPNLEGRPVIVLSNNDGCAISRSDEAKRLGIAMAAPAYMMKELIDQHNITVFSSNYTLYADMSNRIMETLTDFVPKIEIYSIDEAFLDLQEMTHTDLSELAGRIRQTIRRNIGIPVSVGLAATKTLAKMANRYARKKQPETGVYWASDPARTEEMLQATAVGDIWGIGHQYALLLLRAGFKTAADLARAPDDWIQTHLSVVGLRILYELRGVPSIPWEGKKAARKNICTSRSFGTRIGDKAGLAEAIANHAAACASKLRSDKTCCRRLQIFIQTSPHKTDQPQYRRSIDLELERASNHTGEIIQRALQGLELIFKPGFQYKKCGVTVMDIVTESVLQTSFFDVSDQQKNATVMKTMDQINRDLGKDMLRTAAQGFERKYKLKAEYHSPHYTTRMDEILKIRI